jgi:hypothetical protein
VKENKTPLPPPIHQTYEQIPKGVVEPELRDAGVVAVAFAAAQHKNKRKPVFDEPGDFSPKLTVHHKISPMRTVHIQFVRLTP